MDRWRTGTDGTEWMGGWVDGQMNGWMDGWIGGESMMDSGWGHR